MDINSFVIGYKKGKASGGGGGGDLAFNIHYGAEAPADTSKLWVKTSEPSKVVVAPELESAGTGAELAPPVELATLSTASSGMYTGAAAVGTKIYLFGGEDISYSIRDTIQCFDTETETLTTLSAKLPEGLRYISAAAIGTKIYLFGGDNYSCTRVRDTIMCFDTETETLTTLSAKLPTARCGMASSVAGTKIYLMGGYLKSWGKSDTMLCFDTETETLTTLSAKLPEPQSGHGSATVGAKLYLIGGNNGSDIKTIQYFDTETETLTILSAKLPRADSGIPVAAVGTKIYLLGNASSTTIMCFDTETETLTTLSAQMPQKLFGAPAVTVGTKIYLFGGNRSVGGIYDKILRFSAELEYILASGTLHIITQTKGQLCVLVETSAFVWETGLAQLYKGDENDKPEPVEAYLYNETTSAWELI
jgi:N-acetylneuraminic acid mutarotase